MKEKMILAFDQGTTSSRAILFNHCGEVIAISQREFAQIFPQSGWVEHNPNDIWSSQFSAAAEVVAKAGVTGGEIAAIGITNQRETTIVWERSTGNPIYNAIVWQDRRTADYCRLLHEKGFDKLIKETTGLRIDPYFSATKIHWILENVPGAREKADKGELCFGTVDTWLIWKLTRGRSFVTDVTNASRTMLFNIHTLSWEDSLLKLFDIPRSMLPEVHESSEIYAETSSELFSYRIPISGIAGDQQAALFGQMCLGEGMVKNTYGTGCFLLMNTGTKPVLSEHNLLTTIAWKIGGETTYALEGSVFVGGSAIQWLRDGLHLIPDAPSVNALAASVPDNGGIYFVPALTGLGAPYWDSYARGMFIGITRGTTEGHIARATLESIAYQVYDVVKAMEADSGVFGVELRVDGGASESDLLLQFQSDLFGFPIIRPKMLETTAMGAAYLAGLAVGYWTSLDELSAQWSIDRTFYPSLPTELTTKYLDYWHKALTRASSWL